MRQHIFRIERRAIEAHCLQSIFTSCLSFYIEAIKHTLILITTKRGKAGKTRVDLNAYNSFNSATSDIRNKYGMDEVQLYVDRANYDEYITNGSWGSNTYKEVFGNSALADGTLQTSIIEDGSFTDWYDTFMQNSTTQNYELSIAGGSEKTNFNISLAAMYDNGLLKDDKMDRYNGRINIDHKINKVVKVGASVAFTFKNHDSRFSLFNAARKMTTITHSSLQYRRHREHQAKSLVRFTCQPIAG